MIATMQATRSFKLAFLKQMLLGFQLSAVSYSSMSLQERKSAIKLSADAAMAFARGSRKWTRGLVAGLAKEEKNESLLRLILGKDMYERRRLLSKPCYSSWKIPRSKKIVRRSLGVCSRRKRKNFMRPAPQYAVKSSSSVLARTLLEKRTQVIKRIVPGAQFMDGFSLLDETLDYVVCLQAQVDLMQNLLTTLEASKLRAHNKCAIFPESKDSFAGK